MKRLREITTVTMLALAAVAFAPAAAIGQADDDVDAELQGPQTVLVRVTNYNRLDMTVYAVSGGVPFRLGRVMTNSTRNFDLPEMAVNQNTIQLVADPLGNLTSYVTEIVSIRPGTKIDLVVEEKLDHTSLWVTDREV